jgi:hypothetical protein
MAAALLAFAACSAEGSNVTSDASLRPDGSAILADAALTTPPDGSASQSPDAAAAEADAAIPADAGAQAGPDAGLLPDAALPPDSGYAPDAALADLDMAFYQCNVEPIVDRSCSMLACHGQTTRKLHLFARGRLRNDEMVPQVSTCLNPGSMVNLNAEGTGTVMCVGWSPHTSAEWQSNFASVRSFMFQGMNPDDSELLRKPSGAAAHGGPTILKTGGPDYQMLRRWLSGEKYVGTCNPLPN